MGPDENKVRIPWFKLNVFIFFLQMACESSCIEEDVNIDSAADAFETKSYEKSKLRVNVQENGDREINYVKGE